MTKTQRTSFAVLISRVRRIFRISRRLAAEKVGKLDIFSAFGGRAQDTARINARYVLYPAPCLGRRIYAKSQISHI